MWSQKTLLFVMVSVLTWRATHATPIDESSVSTSQSCASSEGDQAECKVPTPMKKKKQKSFKKLLSAGKSSFKKGNWQKTISQMQNMLIHFPHSKQLHEVYDLKGMAHTGLFEGKAALMCFQNAMLLAQRYTVELNPENNSTYIKDLTDFQQLVQSHVSQSLQYINTKLNSMEEANNVSLLYSAAVFSEAVGHKAEAEKLLTRIRTLDSTHPGMKNFFAHQAAGSGDLSRAIQLLEESLATDPEQLGVDEIWKHLAAHRCAEHSTSKICGETWIQAFESALRQVPMNVDNAALAVAGACKIMLEQGRPLAEVRALGERGVAAGVLNDALQLPQTLIRGISFAPYRDDAVTWNAVNLLESHYPQIRDEVMQAFSSGKLSENARHSTTKGLFSGGDWRELNILKKGRPIAESIALLPTTAQVVLSIEEALTMVHGASKISVMEPGTHVIRHTGITNSRIRIHMGIYIPDGTEIRVNDESRNWVEGKCLVLDDSYVHEVWHNGTEQRIVLIVDIWHPELTQRQRQATITNPADREVFEKVPGKEMLESVVRKKNKKSAQRNVKALPDANKKKIKYM